MTLTRGGFRFNFFLNLNHIPYVYKNGVGKGGAVFALEAYEAKKKIDL
jgi:hypothetical protein